MRLSHHIETWSLASPFRIANHVWSDLSVLVVELEDAGHCGRGEASGVFYLGDDTVRMARQLTDLSGRLSGPLERELLQRMLPAGGARNALDCALWDLESKRSGRRAWDIAGLPCKSLTTTYSIGIMETPAEAAAVATRMGAFSTLKIKLGARDQMPVVEAIRTARPDATLVIDANQAWTMGQLRALAPGLRALGVVMIEQPLPRGADQELAGYDCPVTLCADESFQGEEDFVAVVGRYRMVNLKLDKTGGLTEALRLAQLARQKGLGVMIGNMLGTSLAMAPAFLLAQLCDFIDLDGPLFMATDRPFGFRYEGERVLAHEAALWG